MNVLEQRQAEAVVSIAKTLRSPDWEQRRYEIAKDILPHTILLEYYGKGLERGVKDAVMIADALIAELKKGGEE
jgi:hypothetical protein|uniref:Uncharacterized protein n=1 Tax=Siphoviridae sp. ctCeQ13 TaxID=2825380 RepID=A0A8S5P9Y3_9CAUD|nr:MAG TPA: hypothetical protein [Siphoviridae sp. ctCeQ13]